MVMYSFCSRESSTQVVEVVLNVLFVSSGQFVNLSVERNRLGSNPALRMCVDKRAVMAALTSVRRSRT